MNLLLRYYNLKSYNIIEVSEVFYTLNNNDLLVDFCVRTDILSDARKTHHLYKHIISTFLAQKS